MKLLLALILSAGFATAQAPAPGAAAVPDKVRLALAEVHCRTLVF